MTDADSHDLLIPLGRHLHRRHDFQRRIAVVLLQGVGRGRNPEHQRDLLHQPQHGVLAGVAGGGEVFPLYPAKLLHYDVVDSLLFRSEGERHLMDTANFLARDLLKGAGDDRLTQNVVQFIGVIDVLGPLTDTEYRGLLRQVAGGEQGVAALVGGNGTAVIRIVVAVHILVVLVVGVDLSAPCNHVDGIVVEQFQLGGKFRDIVSGTGAGSEQLHPTAAETGQS